LSLIIEKRNKILLVFLKFSSLPIKLENFQPHKLRAKW
jgi:hypothetical protein